MDSKLFKLSIFLAAVTATLQKKFISDNDANNVVNVGIENLVKHLKSHAYPTHDVKPLLNKPRATDPRGSLVNINTVNLFLKEDDVKKALDTRSGDDRICAKSPNGRCGCSGYRCENRDEEREDDREGDRERTEVQQILNELENELGKGPLRCAERCDSTGRCGCRPRSEDRDASQLRCRAGRCGRYRTDLKTQIERYGKKYRISNDLDAIVVDISNFKGLLGNLNRDTQTNTNPVDMDYLFGESRTTGDRGDTNLDAGVLNLGQGKDNDQLVTQVVNNLLYKTKQKTVGDDDPIRPNELADFFEVKKQQVVGNALNFVKNSRGDKDLSVLSTEQQYQLQRVRSEVQRLGARTNTKAVERKVLDIILGDGLKSVVLPHNEDNNNVYIPKWVYRVLKATRDDLRTKRLFPLTNKQKLKLAKSSVKKANYWRRNVQNNDNEYGVPFQLQLQGLGQVNP